MEDDTPPPRRFVLKPKEVVPTDQPARPGDGTEISVQLIHQQNQVAEQKKTRQWKLPEGPGQSGPITSSVGPHVLKPKDIDPVDKPARENEDEAIRVQQILLENRRAEEASGWGALKRRRARRSRRNRDFFLIVVPFDIVVAIGMKLMPNMATYIYGSAAIVLVTTVAAWVMYMVMDDY